MSLSSHLENRIKEAPWATNACRALLFQLSLNLLAQPNTSYYTIPSCTSQRQARNNGWEGAGNAVWETGFHVIAVLSVRAPGHSSLNSIHSRPGLSLAKLRKLFPLTPCSHGA